MNRSCRVVAACLVAISTAWADEPAPYTARAGQALATEAALAWSDDASLIWVENDEPVTDTGDAARWSYLFYSAHRDAARAYSIRGSDVVSAQDLSFSFPAPPVEGEWIDSSRALAIAEGDRGAQSRRAEAGRLRSMLLVRGLLHQDAPDAVTWAVVYESANAPGLWIVVDASSGKVVRTWRG
jgi:hypothetical protein